MPGTVPIEPPSVFVDSGGFVALYVPGDNHHESAVRCRDNTLKFARLYTSTAVIAESIAHIQRDNLLDQKSLSDLLSDFLKTESWIVILPVDSDTTTRSFQMVLDRMSRRFGFVDATNILLMEKHCIDILFSYDSFYDGVQLERGHGLRFIQRVG